MSSSLRRAADDAGLPIDEFAEPQSRHVVVDGHRLHYLDWGNDELPTVVLLHGHGLTAHTWDLVALAIRPYVHCVAVDLRGHGDSEWSAAGDYRIPAYVNDTVGLIGEVANGSAVVVGHSLGGIVALRTAIRAPDRVCGTVVIDIGPDSEKRFREGFQEGKAGTAKRLASFMAMPSELDSVEAFVQQSLAFNPRRNPETLRISLMHNLRQLPNGNWAWKYDRRHYGKQQPDEASNHWTDLDQVYGHVLVVRGGRSDILTEAGAQDFVEQLPLARWASVPDAGHTVQGDQPAGLVEVLRPFLNELGMSC